MTSLSPSLPLAGALVALSCLFAPVAWAQPQAPVEPERSTQAPDHPDAERKPPRAHKHREVRLAPVTPERGNYKPVIPPKHVVIPK